MGTCCCVPLCKNRNGFCFPRDRRRRMIWERQIVKSGMLKNKNWTPNKHTRICKDHFRPEDFDDSQFNKRGTERKRPMLKNDAIPSVFSWSKKPKRNPPKDRNRTTTTALNLNVTQTTPLYNNNKDCTTTTAALNVTQTSTAPLYNYIKKTFQDHDYATAQLKTIVGLLPSKQTGGKGKDAAFVIKMAPTNVGLPSAHQIEIEVVKGPPSSSGGPGAIQKYRMIKTDSLPIFHSLLKEARNRKASRDRENCENTINSENVIDGHNSHNENTEKSATSTSATACSDIGMEVVVGYTDSACHGAETAVVQEDHSYCRVKLNSVDSQQLSISSNSNETDKDSENVPDENFICVKTLKDDKGVVHRYYIPAEDAIRLNVGLDQEEPQHPQLKSMQDTTAAANAIGSTTASKSKTSNGNNISTFSNTFLVNTDTNTIGTTTASKFNTSIDSTSTSSNTTSIVNTAAKTIGTSTASKSNNSIGSTSTFCNNTSIINIDMNTIGSSTASNAIGSISTSNNTSMADTDINTIGNTTTATNTFSANTSTTNNSTTINTTNTNNNNSENTSPTNNTANTSTNNNNTTTAMYSDASTSTFYSNKSRELSIHRKTAYELNRIWTRKLKRTAIANTTANKAAVDNIILNHCDKLSKTNSGVNKIYICYICGECFESKQEIDGHSLIHADSEEEITRVVKEEKFREPDIYKCHVCDKISKSRCVHNEHILTHSDEYTFMCELCGKAFKNKTNFQAHTFNIHCSVDKRTCKICSKVFASYKSLKKHSAVHNDKPREKKFRCEKCGMGFTSRNILNQHIVTHTRIYPHNCNECGKGFHVPCLLRKHLVKVHNITGSTVGQSHACV